MREALKSAVFCWKWAKNIFVISVVFWWWETMFFLGWYGWHIKAIGSAEKICDTIANVLLWIAFVLFVITITSVLNYLLSPIKKLKP